MHNAVAAVCSHPSYVGLILWYEFCIYLFMQLIYDFKDYGASLGLISTLPDEIPEEDTAKFTKIGVQIPSMA